MCVKIALNRKKIYRPSRTSKNPKLMNTWSKQYSSGWASRVRIPSLRMPRSSRWDSSTLSSSCAERVKSLGILQNVWTGTLPLLAERLDEEEELEVDEDEDEAETGNEMWQWQILNFGRREFILLDCFASTPIANVHLAARSVDEGHLKSLEEFAVHTQEYRVLDKILKCIHNVGRFHSGAQPIATVTAPTFSKQILDAAIKESQEGSTTDADSEEEPLP
ncbi:hypothetical protein C8R46DRAFT_1314233 [Mycena filopes]|nr:hypothetical protein C8R46DRAFT_1314233 [Mycena filopes]